MAGPKLAALPAVQQHKDAWLTQASQLLAAGDQARASLLLDTVISAHSSSIDAYYLKTQSCLQLGASQEALQAAR